MNPDVKGIVNKAVINGQVLVIDLASQNRNAYSEIEFRLKYLGQGYYHSHNGRPANDKTLTHFWVENTEDETVQDAANTTRAIKQLIDVKNAFVDAYKTSCEQFAVMVKEIIKLRKDKAELLELFETFIHTPVKDRPSREEMEGLLKKFKAPVKKAIKS